MISPSKVKSWLSRLSEKVRFPSQATESGGVWKYQASAAPSSSRLRIRISQTFLCFISPLVIVKRTTGAGFTPREGTLGEHQPPFVAVEKRSLNVHVENRIFQARKMAVLLKSLRQPIAFSWNTSASGVKV